MLEMQQFRIIYICKDRYLFESKFYEDYEYGHKVFRSHLVKQLNED